MSDNKRYYWIKLKTDFFNQETIDFMLSQKNGCEYVVLYQMLCLRAANNNGELSSKIGEMIVPYDIEKIVRDTKYFDFDTVVVALDLFKKLGLIYEEEDKVLKISNFDEMVGSEVSSAKRVREFRERQKVLQCNTNVTQEIEYRDKILDIDIDNKEININKPNFEEEFATLWKQYPKKIDKSGALHYYKEYRKKGTTYEEVKEGLEKYLEYCKKTEWYSPRDGIRWFKKKGWEDDYTIEQQPKKETREELNARILRELEEEKRNEGE